MNAVTFTIGGEQIAVRSMRFGALKRAWPHIGRLKEATEVFDRAQSCIAILASAIYFDRPDLTSEVIEEEIYPNEVFDLVKSTVELLKASDVIASKPQVLDTAADAKATHEKP